MPSPADARRSTTRAFSIVMILLGLAILGRTIAAGGGVLAVGILLGVLFVAVGMGRLWISRRTP